MIIKRGKTWTYSFERGRDENGDRQREWGSGYPTRKAAEQARAESMGAYKRGEYVEPSDMPVGTWLQIWLESRTSIAETTRVGYQYEVNRLTRAFGTRKLQQLTSQTISGFYRGMIDSGLSSKTVRNCAATLHKSLADAVAQNILVRNPADHVELPRVERREMRVWTSDEMRQFLQHTEGHRLHAAFVLLCSSGMRRSELLGVRWASIDLDDGRLAVVDTVVPVDNKPVLRLGETKSRLSRRVIALDGRTLSVLRAHKTRQNEERIAAGPAYDYEDLVFAGELGGIISPDWFSRATKRLASEAGVPALTPHAARHSWASLALTQGVPAKVVQERLGHSSISITLDRYSHLVDGMDRDAAETVAALIQ